MPEIGDTWTPSMPFPLTDREKKEIKDKKRDEEREKNRVKNKNRKEGLSIQKHMPKNRVEAGKQLRRAFGGAFGRSSSESVKFMAEQGTTKTPEIIPGENEEETNG